MYGAVVVVRLRVAVGCALVIFACAIGYPCEVPVVRTGNIHQSTLLCSCGFRMFRELFNEQTRCHQEAGERSDQKT